MSKQQNNKQQNNKQQKKNEKQIRLQLYNKQY